MKHLHAWALVLLALLWPGTARSIVEGEPAFAGFWSDKEPGGVGDLYYDMSWDGLVTRWKELGPKGRYLADVEAYRRDGQWRFAHAARSPGRHDHAEWPAFRASPQRRP